MKDQGPLRVGFVIDSLIPGSGTENQLILLLRRMDRHRIAPALCCLRDPHASSLDLGGCPVINLGVERIISLHGLRRLLTFIRWARKSDLEFVVTFFQDANAFGTVGSWLAGIRVISSRRNLGRGYWHTPRQILLLRILNRLTYWHIANSQAVRDYTVEAERVAPRRISVLPNAIDLSAFKPLDDAPREVLRARYGLPDRFLIACVANLRPVKGIDVLLRAFADSPLMRSRADLLLLGSGPEERRLRRLAAESGIDERVLFMGNRNDVADILRLADVSVLPSRAESLPNAIIEAMASGLPVVASNVGGIAELLDGGRCGVLVPPESESALRAAIEMLIDDPSRRAELGKSARNRAESAYRMDVVVERWISALEELRVRKR